jgi:hypothetical protein
MGLSKGDQVVATRGLGGWIFAKVPEGTEGTVLIVKPSWWETTCLVKWRNGEVLEAPAKDLHRL